jgi:hypothetical protein
MSSSTSISPAPSLDASVAQARQVADEAIGRLHEAATVAADVVAEKAPAATALSQQAVATVGERLDRSPDETLLIAAALTAGIWVGMALSKAPRWLLLVAVIPTAILVLAVLPRFATRKARLKAP